VAVLIEDAAHHLDLRAGNPADPEAVKQARLTEIKYIQKWIDGARDQNKNK
jgi:lysosomal Pro-X carboxypeptidase